MYTRDAALLRRSARRLLSLAVVALAVLALAAPVQAVQGEPPGNTSPETSTGASGADDGTGVLVMVLVVLAGGAGAVLATAPIRRNRDR